MHFRSLGWTAVFLCTLLGTGGLGIPAHAFCEDAGPSPNAFLPSWKLLNSQQKQYFMSGYLKGFRDASKVTEIALEYLKQNPQSALQGLTELKNVYDLSELSALELSRQVDVFFADPLNRDKSLSQAVSASKQRR